MTKDELLKFIKGFTKITLKKVCKKAKVDYSNFKREFRKNKNIIGGRNKQFVFIMLGGII